MLWTGQWTLARQRRPQSVRGSRTRQGEIKALRKFAHIVAVEQGVVGAVLQNGGIQYGPRVIWIRIQIDRQRTKLVVTSVARHTAGRAALTEPSLRRLVDR